jgi:uncharacterized protein
LPEQLPKLTLVGTYTIYFALLATSATLLPLAIAANFAGIWLVRRTPTGLLYQIAYVLVSLISN